MKSNKRISVISFVVGILISVSAISVFASQGYLNRSYEEPTVYAVNEHGLTYGSAAHAVSVETEPDLISAVGKDGTKGYVYSKDLRGEMPKTPEEAVQMTLAREEAKKSGETVNRVIPLYDVDGNTIIGEFEIAG